MSIEQFLQEQNAKVKELLYDVTTKVWMAQTTGDKEWAEKLGEAQAKLNTYQSDSENYKKAITYLQSPEATPIQKRELLLLINNMKENQLPEEVLNELASMSSELNYLFNTCSPEVDGKKLSANDIRDILVKSDDNVEREKAWKASKEVGKVVEEKLLTLIKKRNESARGLGYNNHHEMAFELQELDREEIFATFQKLLDLSDSTYRALKQELDEGLAKRFNLSVDELRPWHYADPFFQSAPATKETNLDPYFEGKDIVELTSATFYSMGIDIKDLYEKSDLYPREGKNPTAFCLDVDRKGDIRVLCNLTSTSYWMATNLHEFGHAAYNKYTDRELPFSLRQPAHVFTTEAIAMLFGKMVKEPMWLEKFLHLDSNVLDELAPALKRYQQLDMLASARFIITFVFFERELYENPDQDLNALWWKLVEEIQMMKAPEGRNEPDWAAKIHFTLAPVYYQNYLLGELTAAQLHQYIDKNVSKEFFTPEVGTLIKEQFLKPGAMYHWNEKIERVTGEPLNPEYFVVAFCK
ncbi:M2 family metallopeptidase [Cytobacillus suaedae]|nr:M2 family metallopeptidase [Cytobacillus suaedae]